MIRCAIVVIQSSILIIVLCSIYDNHQNNLFQHDNSVLEFYNSVLELQVCFTIDSPISLGTQISNIEYDIYVLHEMSLICGSHIMYITFHMGHMCLVFYIYIPTITH